MRELLLTVLGIALSVIVGATTFVYFPAYPVVGVIAVVIIFATLIYDLN